MTKSQKLLLAELLELAGDEFNNHTCNDRGIPNTPENRELQRKVLDSLGASWVDESLNISDDGKTIISGDDSLMYYFAKLLKDEAQAGSLEGGDSLLEEKR